MPASARATGDDSSPMVDTLLKSTSYAMTFLSADSTSCSPQGLQYKPIESQLWKGTGRPVGVEEDATRRALSGNQRETTWRDAIFEQSFSFAEHHRSDPHAIFVDEIGADQRLQQRAAAQMCNSGPTDAISRRISSTTSPLMRCERQTSGTGVPCSARRSAKATRSSENRDRFMDPLPFVVDRRSRHSTLVLPCRRFRGRRQGK